MTSKESRYWRGVVLYSICEFLQIPKEDYEPASKRIHKALKRTFDVHSFSDLSTTEFEKIVGTVRMLFAREFGWMIPEPNEHDIDLETITMREFLKHKKLI